MAAVDEGIRAAQGLCPDAARPWIMVSINDDADPHFRKAVFDPERCPPDCPRPCQPVCPANAIFTTTAGVDPLRCYGCGRCLAVCPLGLISAASFVRSPSLLVAALRSRSLPPCFCFSFVPCAIPTADDAQHVYPVRIFCHV